MSDVENVIINLKQEMNRGNLVLAVLSQLDNAQYGYSLIEKFKECGLDLDQNTLYPLLRRIEKQGLCESIWLVEENRPRHYYKITKEGIEVRNILINEWKKFENSLMKLLGGIYD
jgi:PadR family transcriptional regulator, regulatory protein PadR